MKSMSAFPLTIMSCVLPILGGPPNDNSTFPSTLSQCSGAYKTGELNTTNYHRCNNWNDGIDASDDQKFVTYDAYYNGTMTLIYTPLGLSPRRPYLAPVRASLAIGQMDLSSNPIFTRYKWDANNFFLALNSFAPPCGTSQTCTPTFHTMSSSSDWYWSQAWTLMDTKNVDGFDISGKVTITKAMSDKHGLYFALPADNTNGIATYSVSNFLQEDSITMAGHISPAQVDVMFTVANFHVGSAAPFATLQYVFSGQPWKDGAQLVTTGDHQATTGHSKEIIPSAPRNRNIALIGSIAGCVTVLIIVAMLIVFCCVSRSDAQRRQWQQDQHYVTG